jgi:integrase/recombinase XerD
MSDDHSPSDRSTSPLRQKMIRVLQLHRKADSTIDAYVTAVELLAKHYQRSPDQISIEQVRDFIHFLITERKLSYSTCNQRIAGINFFYRHVLGQTDFHLRIPIKRAGRLPEPLSRSEISRLIAAATNLKHRALMMTVYGAGLRVSELVRLRPENIHADRMLIRIDCSKGHKDRYTLLSPRMLTELREYWKAYRPSTWLFTNRDGSGPLPKGTAQGAFDDLKQRAKIVHGHGIHSLRHSFGTHLMEAGVPLPVIQRLMGHAALSTTAKYLHVSSGYVEGIRSPLDLLRMPEFQGNVDLLDQIDLDSDGDSIAS